MTPSERALTMTSGFSTPNFGGLAISPLINGTCSYAYRFSIDAGANFTLADVDGAGSNPGFAFDPSSLGQLTVTGGTVPEPGLLGWASFEAWILQVSRRRVTPD